MSLPHVRGKGRAKEKYYFKPGNLGFPVFDTPFGVHIGVQICYDRFFPEGVRSLGLAGDDLLFVPTCAAGTLVNRLFYPGRDHPRVLPFRSCPLPLQSLAEGQKDNECPEGLQLPRLRLSPVQLLLALAHCVYEF